MNKIKFEILEKELNCWYLFICIFISVLFIENHITITDSINNNSTFINDHEREIFNLT